MCNYKLLAAGLVVRTVRDPRRAFRIISREDSGRIIGLSLPDVDANWHILGRTSGLKTSDVELDARYYKNKLKELQ